MGAYDIKDLFPEAKQIFKNPKPVQVIQRIISFALGNGDIFMDFFSGSGTSAESLFRYITSQNSKNTFIHIQLQEKTKEGSEAASLGYSTIDQIGIERIKRAAAKIREEHPDTTADLGFKHFTLKEPAGDTLDKLLKFTPEDNGMFSSDLVDEFGVPTVLTTWLVRDGYPSWIWASTTSAWICWRTSKTIPASTAPPSEYTPSFTATSPE